ncbi:MAG: hypothetical protein WB805_16125 [Candidatus Dormiibacterota bacterium]
MTTQHATLPAWSVHLGTTGSTCVRFACDVVRDGDPWPLSRVVADLSAGGASLAERPRALGSGRGIPLVHSQRMVWRGTTLELEAHHLRDGGHDEVSVTLPAWDELTTAVSEEDEVWEMIDVVAAAIMPRFGIIGDGEAIEVSGADTGDWRRMLRRHTGLLTHTYMTPPPSILASLYRTLPRSCMIAFVR